MLDSYVISLRHTLIRLLIILSAVVVSGAASAVEVNPKASPQEFLGAVANNMLTAVKEDPAAINGQSAAIAELVREYALPYIDMEKTTRLSAGRYWRDASASQKQELVQAFTGTLIRTYSGAFTKVTDNTSINLLPFRGDPNATDAVVRTTITMPNSPAVAIDYRLGRVDSGWKLYDLNVEGIWLIQNYRNQFADEIQRSGIDGLIAALNGKNQ